MIWIMTALALSLVDSTGEFCLVVDHPQILAADLATRIPEFQNLPRESSIGASPWYGQQRTLSAAQLRQFATSLGYSLQTPLHDLCVYRASSELTPIEAEQAVRESLISLFHYRPGDSELEILETRAGAAPRGVTILEKSGLQYQAARSSYVWQGRIQKDLSSGPIAIRFRLKRNVLKYVTARSLAAGHLVTAADLESKEYPVRPDLNHTAQPIESSTIEQLAGRQLRRSVAKGTVLESAMLAEPPLIQQGQPVELWSTVGQTRIRTDAVAKGKARRGEPILVRVLANQQLIHAVAVDPGRVEIQAQGKGRKP